MSISAMSTFEFPPPMNRPPMAGAWTAGYWLTMLVMWWVMMVAMMLPSAAPMLLLFAAIRRRAREGGAAVSTAWLAAGYLLAWLGFSVAAVVLQFGFERAGLVHGMMMWSLSPWLSVGLLVAAGLYQLTPLKQACLSHCRTPLAFLMGHWRPGQAGALHMGLVHGIYCVGCCWFLMALLFVGGIMNVVWIAGLARDRAGREARPARPGRLGRRWACSAWSARLGWSSAPSLRRVDRRHPDQVATDVADRRRCLPQGPAGSTGDDEFGQAGKRSQGAVRPAGKAVVRAAAPVAP